MSILGVVVVCPVILDPAIETLVSSFEEGMCQTIYSGSLRGMSNCTWTSCREGCTADIYTCTQILVLYVRGSQDSLFPNPFITGNESIGSDGALFLERGLIRRGWDLPEYDYSFTYARDLNLSAIHASLVPSMNGTHFEIGALLPNPQGCIYPVDIQCSDFISAHGNLSQAAFPCFFSSSNASIVVRTVDRMGAVRNIFYSFVPLVCAFGVFTYLFYQVGLIGKKRRLKDEETGDGNGSPEKNGVKKNGGLPAPGDNRPVVKTKLRKKFLPKRDNSSKKRRKGKIFNKKNLLVVKQQMSMRSPGSSVGGRDASPSLTSEDFGGSFSNNTQSSRQLEHRQSVQPV
jgi:hypothetical protein